MQKFSNKKPIIVYISFFFFLYTQLINAAIPQSAKDDPRYALGYLVVSHYPGVNPDGTGDSRAGIQQAIDDAMDNQLVVFFPPGTYQVSDVLKCYYWTFWNPNTNAPYNPPGRKAHILIGSNLGDARPVIKLAANAPGFDNPSNPRPLIVWRMFTAINENGVTKVEPDNPFNGDPPNFRDQPNIIFAWHVRNIDLDLGGNPGAIGGVFRAAQYCGIADMKINATGAYAGIYGVPGRNSFISNIEIEGGRFGIHNDGSTAGSVLFGARLYNQTESAIVTKDFCPYSIVGFHIKTSAPIAVNGSSTYNNVGYSTMTLVDGKIEMMNEGIAINNLIGKDIHVSNVYIKGAGSLVKNASLSPLEGSNDWLRIIEYTYNNQRTPSGNSIFNSFSIINGVVSQDPEPLTRVESAEPPENLLDRHLMGSLPVWEGQNDGTINVKSPPYNAKGDGTSDDWAAIQGAINASANGWVFLPKGNYVISQTLALKPNTRMIGLDQNYAVLISSPTWVGGQTRYMVESANDPDAATFFGFIGLDDQAATVSSTTGGYIHWKAGKNSTIMMVRNGKKWGSYYGKYPRYEFHFSANAGGRHMISPHYPPAGDHVGGRLIFIEGTNQPLTFYGLNVESNKPTSSLPDMAIINSNIEIQSSSNIRIHSIKREGNSSTLVILNSQNIGVYGLGRQIVGVKPEWEGEKSYIHVLGATNDVVIATHTLDNKNSTDAFLMFHEAITGQAKIRIEWPSCVSIYKRGELSDIYIDRTSTENIDVKDPFIPQLSIYPNPYSNEVSLDFSIPAQLRVNVAILDVQNRVVKVLADETLPEGDHKLKWDGRDHNGTPMKHGVYFIRMMAGNTLRSGKVVLIN